MVAALTARNLCVEAKLRYLRNNYAKAIDDCAASRDKLKKFEAEVQSKAHREEEAVLHLQADIEALTLQKELLKSKNMNQYDYIKSLESSNMTANEAAATLRNEIKVTLEKHKKEKADLISDRRTRVKALKKVVSDKTKTVDKLSFLVQDLENNENPTPVLTDAAVQVPVLPLKVHDVGVQVPVLPLQVNEVAVQVPEELVETEDNKKVSVNLALERMEKKGIQTLPGGWFDCSGYSISKTFARLYDKDGLYMCTLAQEFEDTTEFSTIVFIGEAFKDEDYKGGLGGLLESEQEDT